MTNHQVSRIINQPINPGTEYANYLGFRADKFHGYLWDDGSAIIISFITSLDGGKGNTRKLIKQILRRGRTVKVPSPLPRMESIVERMNFEKTREPFEAVGEMIDVWVKHPKPRQRRYGGKLK